MPPFRSLQNNYSLRNKQILFDSHYGTPCRRAVHVLTSAKSTSKSWFLCVRNLFLQYKLPHPLTLLDKPISKEVFKKLAKSKVVGYWEDVLRQEASFLPSMLQFRPAFSSLTKPHSSLWTAGSNPHEVTKAVIQLKMLSGRYPTESVRKHWSGNRNGWCPSPLCFETEETLEHLLLWCP